MPLDDDFLKQKRFQRQSLRPEEQKAVDAAKQSADCKAKRKGEKIDWTKPGALVRNYIHRFRDILEGRPTPERRARAIKVLKEHLHKRLLIHADHEVFTVSPPERIREILQAPKNPHGKPLDPQGKPYSLSHFDKRIIRFYEEGRGVGTVPEEERQEEIADILQEQQHSLDAWIDYLASDDAKYPDVLKYWAFRSLLKMGRFDKDTHTFTNREGGGSTSPFPDLNREALAIVFADTEKKYAGRTDFAFTARYDIPQDRKDAYQRALGMEKKEKGKDTTEDFATLYTLTIDAFKPISEDLLTITDGVWMTYPQGSDPMTYVPTTTLNGKTVTGPPLVPALADYGTGWCIRGEPTAQRYLDGNTLSVYFSQTSKEPDAPALVPRVVMVINPQNQITEVRGIKAHEHLDAHIIPTVDQKLSSHPDGEKYRKKTKDMERLTTLDRLLKSGTFPTLSQEDQKAMLTFLYELDSQIEGFGYEAAGRDPRIEELRSKRSMKEDLPILFGCMPDQIALAPKEISSHTKAYIGPLAPGIFSLLEKYSIEHIYTSFPEGKIRRESLEIGTLTAEELATKLDEKDPQGNGKFRVSSYARGMLQNKEQFMKPVDDRYRRGQGKPETITLVRLRVRDLGYNDPSSLPTTRELFGDPGKRNGRIHHYGFELCPPETAPYYRLSHSDQPMGDWFYVGMEPVTGSDDSPYVFSVRRGEDGLCLLGSWTEPGNQWGLGSSIMVRLGKSDS